jgi:hypothetical protein
VNKKQLISLLSDYPDDTEVRVVDRNVIREIGDVELVSMGVSFKQSIQVLGIFMLGVESDDGH